MKTVNLRELYPDFYKTDYTIEVPDEVAAAIRDADRQDAAYRRRAYYHKAHYSLDRGDGIEYDQIETGSRIHTLRKEKNLSCVKVARSLDISESLLRKVESGERPVSIRLLLSMAEFYGVSTDYILKGPRPDNSIQQIDEAIDILRKLKMEIEKN